MGTRSLTVMKDDQNEEIAVLYRQYDGYPDGHGKDLVGFLLGASANGMDCLAAQIVAHFKMPTLRPDYSSEERRMVKIEDPKPAPGGYYLMAAGTRDVGEEYIYTVYPGTEGDVYLKIDKCWGDEILYDGPLDGYAAYLKVTEGPAP